MDEKAGEVIALVWFAAVAAAIVLYCWEMY